VLEQRPGILVMRCSEDRVLAGESGGHRWQRIPPTERGGRVHTSTITVAVLPEPTEPQLRIAERDLEWSAVRGSGAGGQARNKTSNCIVLKHLPSGLIVRCESERSQHQNRADALAILRSRIYAASLTAATGVRDRSRAEQIGSGMRGDKRRTVRVRDDQVTDHRSGKRWTYEMYRRGVIYV
jgi:peptide chain release factor 1